MMTMPISFAIFLSILPTIVLSSEVVDCPAGFELTFPGKPNGECQQKPKNSGEFGTTYGSTLDECADRCLEAYNCVAFDWKSDVGCALNTRCDFQDEGDGYLSCRKSQPGGTTDGCPSGFELTFAGSPNGECQQTEKDGAEYGYTDGISLDACASSCLDDSECIAFDYHGDACYKNKRCDFQDVGDKYLSCKISSTKSVIWTVTQDWTGEQWSKTPSKVRSFKGLSTDKFHLECVYSAFCEERGRGTTEYWLHNQDGIIFPGGGYYCCDQRDASGWTLNAEIATPVEWTVTQDWTGDKNPKTKRKVRTFRGLSTDEFHLECRYSKYCEENGHGTTAYWLYDQRGNVVERDGYFCCEQDIYSNIDDWTLTATSKPLSSDADFEIPNMSAVEESMTFQVLRRVPTVQILAIIGGLSMVFYVFRAFLPQNKYEEIQDEAI